jgi:Tfp pilus assembly protein PilF
MSARLDRGLMLFEQLRFELAETEFRGDLAEDPQNAISHALLTFRLTERGLERSPEDVPCTNMRAMALVRLNRRDEAGATIATALARNPEIAFSHANQGWTLLHQGDHRRAIEHFREALRLDP